MKKSIALILIVILALGMSVTLTGCGGSSAPAATEAPTEAPTEEVPATEAPTPIPTLAPNEPGVDFTIPYGDFANMQQLAMNITNMYANNKVVSIDGDLEITGGTCFITESSAEGKVCKSIITVEGWAEADYPATGAHIKIKGTVLVRNMKPSIVILPEDFQVVE